MLSRNRLVLRVIFSLIAISALAVLAGCGSSTNKATPPPSGGFSNSNLNGTYVFSTSGADVNNFSLAFAGTFTANGSGGISGGTLSVTDPASSTIVSSGVAITGGAYNVGVDGRPLNDKGLLTLVTSSGTFTFDFVIASDQNGQITYYDTNSNGGTGSGTYALQSTVSQSNVDGQSYAFNVVGATAISASESQSAFAIAGAFTLDSNGQIGVTTSGIEDVNNGGGSVCGAAGCAITSGSISLANVPGTASFTTSAGTFTFDVYPVDATDLKFIETDGSFFASGDAFTSSSSISAGTNVFAVAGVDTTNAGPISAVGLLATDGNGNVTNTSTEDFNDAGTTDTTPATYSGTYTPVSGGRSVVTLTGFVKGDGGLGCSGCYFAAYPSSGGIQLLEIDNAGFVDGAAYSQSATTFASGSGYGMDLTGVSDSSGAAVEEDDIAEFADTSGALAGLIDFNDIGSTAFDKVYSATYAADTSGISGRGTVTSGNNSSYDMVTYVVDSSLTLGIVTDSTMVALGTVQTQASTSSAKTAATHFVIPRIPPHAKSLKSKQANK